MTTQDALREKVKAVGFMSLTLFGATACTRQAETMDESRLTELATSYAAAWSSQHPQELASHYAESGSLAVNDGTRMADASDRRPPPNHLVVACLVNAPRG